MPISEEGLHHPKPFIFSHSGQKIGPGYQAPSVEDIAVSLGRICRFAGHGLKFWSVLLHSFVVQDLVCEEAKGIAILHDASETVFSDIPTPFKEDKTRLMEADLLNTIFREHLSNKHYKSYHLNPDIWKMVKIADTEAFLGEVGVIGTKALRSLYPERSVKAEKLVRKYLKKYSVLDTVSNEGIAVIDFIRRVKDYQ